MKQSCYLAGGCDKRRIGDGRDITRSVKAGQALFCQTVKTADKDGFGKRLRQAFKGAGNSEIARQLGTEPSTLTNYMKGRIPPPETLVAIANLTSCSIDWLITGEGEADLDPYRFLNEKVRALVERMAANDRVDFGKALELLIVDALVRRGSYLFTLYPRLRGREMDELRLLFSLIQEGAENDEDEVQKPAAKGKNVA